MPNKPIPKTSRLAFLLVSSLVVSCGPPPPPMISQISPEPICDLNPTQTFTITGTGFLKSDTLPQVTFTNVANAAMTATAAASDLGGCMDKQCTTLTVNFPNTQLPDGKYDVTIHNNCDADTCTSTLNGATTQVDVVPPPTLTAVAPTVICQGVGTLTLTGSKFSSFGVASIGSATSMSVTVSNDGTMATANFAGMLPLSQLDQTTFQPVPLDVTFQNAMGCSATLPSALTVTPGPSILFVDPPVVPPSYAIQLTVYAASVASPIKGVQIAPNGSSNFVDLTPLTLDPKHPNRALVTLPTNLTAGSYDMKLTDQTTCSAMLPNAFKVSATSTLQPTMMAPSFGALGANTSVQITEMGAPTPPFVSTPRAYVAINGGTSASTLRAVTFNSGTSLSAVVPDTLAAGNYDLIIVNPDGSYGIKANAFTVTASGKDPPIITSIAPSSVIQGTAAPITINGSNFRSPAVTAACYDSVGTKTAGTVGSVVLVSTSKITATLMAATGVLYCVVTVTDGDNLSSFAYSAVGVTNASFDLTGFTASANGLTTARRALSAAAGRPTQTARFVYAAGGDNGTDNGTLKSVETAPTDPVSGVLGKFFTQAQQLPKALSFLGVVNVGRFLYAVGGYDGVAMAAVKDVYRAEILDPLNAPQFTDVDVRPDMTQGLAPGLYTYRISAVMLNTDANNPGGETLASDFFPVQVQQVSMGKLQLVLYFKQQPAAGGALPGALKYNIYRTINAGDAAGTELFLGTVNDNGMATQSFVDNGATTPAGAKPLPIGSTGAWKPLAQLATARAGAGVVAAPDPTTAGTYYLLAMGGNSGSPSAVTLQSSVETMTITLASNGALQNTSANWSPLKDMAATTQSLPTGRWLQPGLFATNAQNSNVPANQTFIYAGSGLSSNLATGTADQKVYVAQLVAGGTVMSAFADSGSVGVGNPGYGGALVNNQMLAFGGIQASNPTTASVKAKLTSPLVLGNFSALGGGVLQTARAYQGTAIESAFIYQLGGYGGPLGGPYVALTSAEQTIW